MSAYKSSNYAKHTNPNPLQQWLIGRFHDAVVDLLPQSGTDTLLEVGCGEGFSSEVLRRRAKIRAFHALDLSVSALKVARTRLEDSALVGGSALNLPYADDSFDTVVCLEVLEHLSDPLQALLELSRVARAYLLLSVPNEPFFQGANFLRGKNLSRWGNDPGHVQHWSHSEFRRWVGQQFQVLNTRAPFPWTMILCRV